MAALDREEQIAGRRLIAGRDVEIDAELFADHVLGLADAGHAVERKAGRQRVHDDAAASEMMRGRSLQHAMNVVFGDFAAADDASSP